MPNLRDLLPHSPTEGPPVPRILPGWPSTPEDVERAVREYAESAEKAIFHYQMRFHSAMENYRISMQWSVEKYRQALRRMLPPEV